MASAIIERRTSAWMVLAGGLCLLIVGCSDRPTLFPNPDPELRKTKTELRAEAAERIYPHDAPRAAESKVRAQAHYASRRIELVNFTGDEWTNVEVWVNRQFVCVVPHMQDRQLKEIAFSMLRNRTGAPFTIDKADPIVQTVEVFYDGKLYTIPCHNGDL